MDELTLKDVEAIEYEFGVKVIKTGTEEPGLIEAFLIDTEDLPEAVKLITIQVEEWAEFSVQSTEEISDDISYSLITMSGGRQCADFYHALKAWNIKALYFNHIESEVSWEEQELADRVYTVLEGADMLPEFKTLGMDQQGELITEIVRRLSNTE